MKQERALNIGEVNMDKFIYNVIMNEYEERRRRAFEDAERRKRKLYQEIDGLEDIDRKIRLLGIKYNKIILQTGSVFNKDIETILSEIDSLKKQKKDMILNAGYQEDYLEVKYSCSLCNDTGFINTETGTVRCECYNRLLFDYIYSKSNLKLVKSENFSNFNESYYSDEVDAVKYKLDISPRENILRIKERSLKFIENFDNSDEKNLFFSGPTGVGKTFMSNCIAYELIKKGKRVIYQTAPKLFDFIYQYKMKAAREDDFDDDSYKDIFEVDLLIIDDLGTEAPTAARFSELLNIINTRQVNNLIKPCKTIISTNMGARELYEYYDERIASRIIGNFDMFRFIGEDIRRIKKIQDKSAHD